MVETYRVTGMSNGDPIDPRPGRDQCGTADQFILDVHMYASLFAALFSELTD